MRLEKATRAITSSTTRLRENLRVLDKRLEEIAEKAVTRCAAADADKALKAGILAVAIAIPVGIGVFAPRFSDALNVLLFLFIIFGFYYVILMIRYDLLNESMTYWEVIKKYVTFLPPGFPTRGNVRLTEIPWATFGLIVANVAMFLVEVAHPKILPYLCFYPYKYTSWKPVQLIAANFASMFLHAGLWHLAGNMLFLWAMGGTLEYRIGWKAFLLLYLVTGTLANVIPPTFGMTSHGIGASGAISGIIGLYVLRCFSTRLAMTLCIFGGPLINMAIPIPLSLRVEMNSLLYVALWFLFQVTAYARILNGQPNFGHIGYEAHVAGYLSGLALGLWLGYVEAGAREMIEERGRNAWGMHGVKDLEKVMEKHGERPELLKDIALRYGTFGYSRRGEEYYRKAVAALLKSDMEAVLELYGRLSKYYPFSLTPEQDLAIARAYERRGMVANAYTALSRVAEKEGVADIHRETALFHMGDLQEKLGNREGALEQYRRFLREFPASPLRDKVRRRMERNDSL